MRRTRDEIALRSKKAFNVLFTLIIVAFIGGIVVCQVLVNKAEKSQNIRRLKENLKKDSSFTIRLDNWAECDVMEDVIEDYNKKKRHNKEEMYTPYKVTEREYWVTSEKAYYEEFEKQTTNFYMCLEGIISGTRKETRTFYFYYMNQQQKSEINFILGILETSLIREKGFKVNVYQNVGIEVIKIRVTIESDESLKGGM